MRRPAARSPNPTPPRPACQLGALRAGCDARARTFAPSRALFDMAAAPSRGRRPPSAQESRHDRDHARAASQPPDNAPAPAPVPVPGVPGRPGGDRPDHYPVQSPATLGAPTQGVYVCVAAVDALWERAVAAGAAVVRPLADTHYGSREFSVRDPEGHVWSFGTY